MTKTLNPHNKHEDQNPILLQSLFFEDATCSALLEPRIGLPLSIVDRHTKITKENLILAMHCMKETESLAVDLKSISIGRLLLYWSCFCRHYVSKKSLAPLEAPRQSIGMEISPKTVNFSEFVSCLLLHVFMKTWPSCLYVFIVLHAFKMDNEGMQTCPSYQHLLCVWIHDEETSSQRLTTLWGN